MDRYILVAGGLMAVCNKHHHTNEQLHAIPFWWECFAKVCQLQGSHIIYWIKDKESASLDKRKSSCNANMFSNTSDNVMNFNIYISKRKDITVMSIIVLSKGTNITMYDNFGYQWKISEPESKSYDSLKATNRGIFINKDMSFYVKTELNSS